MRTTINAFLCQTCTHKGTAQNGSPACALHKKIVTPTEDFCSDHANIKDNINCEWCGQLTAPNNIRFWIFETDTKALCPHCSQMVGTCQTCTFGNECGFANDHSMPQIVNQTVQQGFMTVQTQIKNPKLIEKHCLSCRCSYGDKGTCLRDEHGINCGHWQPGL